MLKTKTAAVRYTAAIPEDISIMTVISDYNGNVQKSKELIFHQIGGELV